MVAVVQRHWNRQVRNVLQNLFGIISDLFNNRVTLTISGLNGAAPHKHSSGVSDRLLVPSKEKKSRFSYQCTEFEVDLHSVFSIDTHPLSVFTDSCFAIAANK